MQQAPRFFLCLSYKLNTKHLSGRICATICGNFLLSNFIFIKLPDIRKIYMINRGKNEELAACSTIWSESIQRLLGWLPCEHKVQIRMEEHKLCLNN
jgi:hypothetical protein